MKENLKLGGILLIISALAGLLLSVAFSITKGPIAETERANKIAAMKQLLPDAENFEAVQIENKEGILDVQKALKGGKDLGYCINVSSKGYGGPINMMIGISADGQVKGVQILTLSETPGLGSHAKDPEFKDQFNNKNANELEVIKEGSPSDNQILAISGATITSKAVTAGVNNAINLFNDTLKGAK